MRAAARREWLRIEVLAPDAATAERVVAEVWSAGALGVEERDAAPGVLLVVHASADAEDAQRSALVGAIAAGARLLAVERVADEDWGESWKRGLTAIVISDRLIVRPSFVPFALAPGQREVIIDPGQAFGTGGHASTRLALEWIDALAKDPAGPLRGARVLDVGTGSGVLALAALLLGAGRVTGVDLDAVAVREAAAIAARNRLGDRLSLVVGGIEAVAGSRFDLVLANLLRSEQLPIAGELAAALAPGGSLIVSGLLESDRNEVIEAFAAGGLVGAGERSSVDPSGERWIALLWRRRR